MKHICYICTLSFFFLVSICTAQENEVKMYYEKAKVSFDDFLYLMNEVQPIREERLISYNMFLEFQDDPNTIILDTRSRELYREKHLKGAVNLPYTEFTQENLERIIPKKDDKNSNLLQQ